MKAAAWFLRFGAGEAMTSAIFFSARCQIDILLGRHRHALPAALPAYLFVDPRVGLFQTFAQWPAGGPVESGFDQPIVRIAPSHAQWTRYVLNAKLLAGNVRDRFRKLIDRYHFLRANIERAGMGAAHQAQRAFDALVDVQKRACLLSIAPDLYGAAVLRLGNFPAKLGRSLLPSSRPGSFRSEDVVIAVDVAFHVIIAVVCQIQTFAEQFLPAIFAVRCGGVSPKL